MNPKDTLEGLTPLMEEFKASVSKLTRGFQIQEEVSDNGSDSGISSLILDEADLKVVRTFLPGDMVTKVRIPKEPALLYIYKGLCLIEWGEGKDGLELRKECGPSEFVALDPGTPYRIKVVDDVCVLTLRYLAGKETSDG